MYLLLSTIELSSMIHNFVTFQIIQHAQQYRPSVIRNVTFGSSLSFLRVFRVLFPGVAYFFVLHKTDTALLVFLLLPLWHHAVRVRSVFYGWWIGLLRTRYCFLHDCQRCCRAHSSSQLCRGGFIIFCSTRLAAIIRMIPIPRFWFYVYSFVDRCFFFLKFGVSHLLYPSCFPG